jgi:NAD(P)-dependent dehydrogenase (short-subunit alcohol dehydrogenase family)
MSGSADRFAGRSVIVTGGAQGLGYATVEAFLAEGANVTTIDIEGDTLDGAVSRLASPDRLQAIVGDVSNREDVRGAIDAAVARFGRLDIAVQVAGIAPFESFLDYPDELWRRTLGINLDGTLYLVQEAARVMVRQGTGGAIAVTSSTNAFQPESGGLGYNTSKTAQVAVMQTAALELAKHGIRVNALAPGIMETRLAAMVIDDPQESKTVLARIPMGRFTPAREMARPILWMCSDDASYMTGELLVFDGGLSVGLPQPGASADGLAEGS